MRATVTMPNRMRYASPSTIARHAMPSFLLMCAAVLLIWFFPDLVTALPRQMKLG